VSLSLFASRVEEMESLLKVWNGSLTRTRGLKLTQSHKENKDKFVDVLVKLSEQLENFLRRRKRTITLSTELNQVKQAREDLNRSLSVITAEESKVTTLPLFLIYYTLMSNPPGPPNLRERGCCRRCSEKRRAQGSRSVEERIS